MLRRHFLMAATFGGKQDERFLVRSQSPDGGWHSLAYGLLRSGQSLTGFVLCSLSDSTPASSVDRGIAFLRANTDDEGAVGRMNPLIHDYPNYATALALSAELRWRRSGWEDRVARLAAYLRSQQFTEEEGWKGGDAPYGAWGMGGDRRTPPHAGHVDLSMTRHVLEALAGAGTSNNSPTMRRARVFLGRLQNDDGGFHFSTVVADANKVGGTRSYGTATADGILSLSASGGEAARIVAARDWLVGHHRPDGAPGFSGEAYRRWPQGLRFYYAAASAKAFHRTGLAPDWEQTRLLRAEQRGDGSWSNPEPLVKEDDPLIATGFALQAILR